MIFNNSKRLDALEERLNKLEYSPLNITEKQLYWALFGLIKDGRLDFRIPFPKIFFEIEGSDTEKICAEIETLQQKFGNSFQLNFKVVLKDD